MRHSQTLAIAPLHSHSNGSISRAAAPVPGLEDLACPRCAGALSPAEASVHCGDCGASYPVDDGIMDVRCGRHDYYFNPVPRERMQALIEGMTAENWPHTVREFVRHAHMNPSWLDNLVVDGRYAWKLMLDLRKDTKVLDLGCGLGNLTHNLAPLVGRVYAMDLTYARLQFSKRRFSIFNPGDDIVPIAGGDGSHLPFRTASLDCVVVSGVLEWVGEGDTSALETGSKLGRLLRMLGYHYGERNPRNIQLRFLREIRRVLKPSGQLFVAIENRLNHEYFAGRRDHHSLLYYGSLLPRALANLYSIAVSRKPYRTYTYSIPGYRKLLTQAGFPNIEFLGFSRGYSALEEITPAEVDAPTWRPASPRTLRDALRRNKYFVPAYGIISSATPAPWPRRQDAVLTAIEQALQARLGEGKLQQHTYIITGRQKLIVRASFAAKPIIVRIPMNAAARDWELANARILQQLGALDARSDFAPRLLCSGEVDGIWYSAEELLEGEPLAVELSAKGRAAMVPEVERLLERLGTSSPHRRRIRLEGDMYARHVTRWLDGVNGVLGDRSLRTQSEAYFRNALYGAEVGVGLMHGDFGTRNVLVREGKACSLIDWESAETDGLPALDAISYLASVQLLFHPDQRMARISATLASGDWPEPAERELLHRSYATHAMDPARHAGWVSLAWLRGACRRLDNTLRFDPSLLDSEVAAVLKSLDASNGG